jgi:hypothetical protein
VTFAPFLAPERDDKRKTGRAKRAAETYYCVPGCLLISAGTGGIDANADFYAPWFTPTPIVIDQLAAEVETLFAGSNFRIGFYKASTDWQPVGAPLADSGNLSSATTGVKTYTPATPIFVPRGRYLSVLNADSANPVFRILRGAPVSAVQTTIGTSAFLAQMEVLRSYAAFPTPGTAWDLEIAGSTPSNHFVVYRVLTP